MVCNAQQSTTAIINDQNLRARGIAQIAAQSGWTIKDENYWRYPVTARDGQVGYRHKLRPGRTGAKYFPGHPKPTSKYYLSEIHNWTRIKQAVALWGGVIYIASGEPDSLVYQAAGMHNVLSWFGESSIPDTIVEDLRDLGVTTVRWPVDNDDAGRKSAAKLAGILDGSGIGFEALSWDSDKPKYDANKLWIDLDCDGELFRDVLTKLEALDISDYQEAQQQQNTINIRFRPIGWAKDSDGYFDSLDYQSGKQQAIEAMVRAIPGKVTQSSDGQWVNFRCFWREDKQPSASMHIESGRITDFGDGNKKYWWDEVSHLVGIEPKSYLPDRPNKRSRARATKRQEEISFEDQGKKDITRPAFTADKTFLERYTSNYQIDFERLKRDNIQAIGLKARLATGKTEWAYRVIDSLSTYLEHRAKVLIVSPLISLCGNIAQRFDANLYSDYDEAVWAQLEQLVITLKSQHKIRRSDGTMPVYDLVILDEFQQLLQFLMDGPIKKGKRKATYNALIEVIQNAGLVLAMDAHLNDVGLNWLRDNLQKDVLALENTYRHEWGRLIRHEHQSSLYASAVAQIEANEGPVVIACGEREESKRVYRMLAAHGIAEEDMILINKETSKERGVQSFIRHIDDEIKKYRVVIVSPSAATGLNITTPVAGVYLVSLNRVQDASGLMQMLMRYRNTANRHVFIRYAEGTRETDWTLIFRRWYERHMETELAADFVGHNIPAMASDLVKLIQLQAQLKALKNEQTNNLVAHFEALACDEGFTMRYQGGKNKRMIESMRAANLALKAYTKTGIINLENPAVSHEEFERHMLLGTINEDVRFGHERYKIETSVGRLITPQLYDDLHTPKKREGLKRFTDLFVSMNHLKGLDRHEAREHYIISERGHHTVTRQIIEEALELVFGPDWIKSEEVLPDHEVYARMAGWMERQFESFQRHVDKRPDLSSNPVAVLRRILKSIGLKLISIEVKDNTGKYVRMDYRLDLRVVAKMIDYAFTRTYYLETGDFFEVNPENTLDSRVYLKFGLESPNPPIERLVPIPQPSIVVGERVPIPNF